MAKPRDIDTKGTTDRYLNRPVITPSTDDEADADEEVTAVLESVAVAMQLQPQIGLVLVYRAKNTLGQLIQADIDTVDFLISAIGDVDNPSFNAQDLSDLVEAQTALIELDRLQRTGQDLNAFQRYKSSVNRFLDDQLAPTLKRKGKKEFERTGGEARQDIFTVLPQFGAAHAVMADKLKLLTGSVEDFRSVPLNKISASRTLGRVRKSLQAIKNRFENGAISPTTAAVELLGGSASMESVSTTSDIMDPTIKTGELPPNRTIYLRSEQDAIADALSTEGPWTIGAGAPWDFKMTMNPLSSSPVVVSQELPAVGYEERVYVTTDPIAASLTYDIPTDGTLYIQVEGSVTDPEQEIKLTTTGSGVPIATIVSELNALLVDATADIWKNDRIAVYGDVGITAITIRGGSSGLVGVGGEGNFNTDPSIHDELGFDINQRSLPLGQFTATSLEDALAYRVPQATFVVEGNSLRISSNLQDPRTSSIQFDGGVESYFGYTGLIETEPAYLNLVENGIVLEPTSIGVYVGSLVTAAEEEVTGSVRRTLNNQEISSIQGNNLYFSQSSLPRGLELSTTIEAPIVCATTDMCQQLEPLKDEFDGDFDDLTQVMSPILSKPTRAQINDALRLLSKIRDRLVKVQNILGDIEIPEGSMQYANLAETIISALEGRGLDRAKELISSGNFSEFFSLTKDNASRSSRFMTAMSNVVNTDMPMSNVEAYIDDDIEPTGTSENDDYIEGSEPSDPRDRRQDID